MGISDFRWRWFWNELLVSQTSCTQPPGFVADGTDCDDTTILRAPNAIEFGNGLDDDCDGDTDELAVDSSYFYIDVDNDGYGEPSESILTCPTVQNEPLRAILL